MTTNLRHYNIRLERSQWDRVAQIARDQKLTPADVIRSALDGFLASGDLLNSSQRRLARISEFQQLALDIIIREQFPEYRDRIIAETDKRLEQYHGA
ncbi:hypothetical protein [Sphingobium yanoikuyae]|uniref:Ribbon-helix-helix domain-containing protein n=1 Tax=Sphingobium yanoikuyae TaxID=13690 RepID=A0A291N054_SPHYA|nr:hypothetical protein [Sphingobium yanoikuyae]ATI80641.1 hypothetical protein A6768_11995 [Sphingobium yanoikuyae]